VVTAAAATSRRQAAARFGVGQATAIRWMAALAATAEAYWQLSKACGVHVYQEGDGWHADLEFKGLPNGVADLIGTPTPAATWAEAIESVVSMMSICKQRDAVPPPDPRIGMRWFKFDQHEVPIHFGLLADYEAQTRTMNTDPADITADLDDIRFKIAGDAPLTTQARARFYPTDTAP